MAISFDRLRKTIDPNPAIITIYGGEGLGKTTFASEAPNPLYVQTGKNERPPTGSEMETFGLCETFGDVIDQADWMLDPDANEDRLTFVVDTLDSLDILVEAEACARRGWRNLSDGNFAEPKNAMTEVWNEFISKMIDLKASGFVVIMIAHGKVKTDPGVTSDSYPRWRLNLKMDDNANAIAHASDIVGYIHQRVSIVKEKAGFHKDNVKVRGESGGDRVIAVEERPGFVAKNRYGLTGTVPFKKDKGYAALAQHFPAPRGWTNQPVDTAPDQEEEDA